VLLNTTKTKILLLTLKLDKLELFLNFLEPDVRFNGTCKVHNSSRYYTLHQPIKMHCLFVLSELVASMAKVQNQ